MAQREFKQSLPVEGQKAESCHRVQNVRYTGVELVCKRQTAIEKRTQGTFLHQKGKTLGGKESGRDG